MLTRPAVTTVLSTDSDSDAHLLWQGLQTRQPPLRRGSALLLGRWTEGTFSGWSTDRWSQGIPSRSLAALDVAFICVTKMLTDLHSENQANGACKSRKCVRDEFPHESTGFAICLALMSFFLTVCGWPASSHLCTTTGIFVGKLSSTQGQAVGLGATQY